jgi:hypothetical protein
MSRSTFEAVRRQVEAMAADLFEIGLYKPATTGGPKEPEMLPRTWDVATLLKSVGWLKYQNANGRNIYIRPKGEHALSLVDDLSAAAVQRMRAEGFKPSIVVETSPGNFQAWLNHGRVLPKAESTLAARALAERFGGDKGAADWRHYGRLSGYTNRKPRYQDANGLYPFVRLITAERGLVYPEADRFLSDVARRIYRRATPPPPRPAAPNAGRLLTIDDFRARPQYAGDGNRIDLAYAVYALAHGVPEADVRAAIASRDLSKKGNESRQIDYLNRTIAKAAAPLSSHRSERAVAPKSIARAR